MVLFCFSNHVGGSVYVRTGDNRLTSCQDHPIGAAIVGIDVLFPLVDEKRDQHHFHHFITTNKYMRRNCGQTN